MSERIKTLSIQLQSELDQGWSSCESFLPEMRQMRELIGEGHLKHIGKVPDQQRAAVETLILKVLTQVIAQCLQNQTARCFDDLEL